MARYKYASKFAKRIKKGAKFIQKVKGLWDAIHDPLNAIIDKGLERLSNLKTARKTLGHFKARIQSYNQRTKRFIVRNAVSGKILRQGSRIGRPFKNIPIV